MVRPPESYEQFIERVFKDSDPSMAKTFTFQVTEDCTLRCSYCYQPVKLNHYMDFDVAKAAIDLLFEQAKNDDFVFSYSTTRALIIEFIGGEPLLATDLIRQIIEYVENKMLAENSPWLYFHRYSFSSNGTLYFNQNFQDLLRDYGHLMSVSITVDGNKKLHDSCRLFPDGTGSYDLALKAALDQKDRFNNAATKITIAPENVKYLFEAVVNMWSLGFYYVFANCCFEEGWTSEHASVFYHELKKIADYLLDNRLEETFGISLFDDRLFKPYDSEEDDDKNWCGGTGAMLAVDYRGIFYPCIRYMPSSLNGEQKALEIGSIDRGIYCSDCDKCILEQLTSITRTSQSSDECLVCPIAHGCAWCSGYNYQKFGTPNKRATFICVMHKARALANLYFWSRYKSITKNKTNFKNNITDEIALSIISQEEWNELKILWGD